MADLRRLLLLLDCMERGDHDGLAKAADEAQKAISHGETADPDLIRLVALVRAVQRVEKGERAESYVALDPPGPPAGGVIRTDLLTAGVTAMRAALEAEANGDVDRLREVARYADDVLVMTPTDHFSQRTLAHVAGLAHLWAARRTGAPSEAARAAARFEQVTTIVGGPHDGQWRMVAMDLAEARRLAGTTDRAGTRRLAMSALRADAWRVLNQTDADDPLSMARDAADRALRLAGWCRADHAYDEMVSALDAGRGLVLPAATRSQGVDKDDTLLGQLRPVRPGELRTALTRIGADALVYLVPANDEWPGAALVVPAAGEVELVELPGLVTGPDSPVRRFTERQTRARDLDPVPSGPAGDELDEVCRYAWDAVVGALVDMGFRRVVLVPMGELSLVPWHAAVTPDGRYAVRDLTFSYAVSARALCTGASAPDRDICSALVVGDPGDDPHYAGSGARAVRDRFYPDGAYFEAATPDDVLDWVAKATGPSLLHFACHGRADPARPADAHLALADGQKLPVRRLLDASRRAELPLERVFLAACTTGAAGDVHDEAFSLAGAFLAAGVRTVFGSLWAVPDAGTSVLMYLVHHYLNSEGARPAEALHRAQLWMLDPDRRPPAGMPAALADLAGGPGLADPTAWAAFTHLGR